jgi:glycosyltransferase involved in cell wall biosynthesis
MQSVVDQAEVYICPVGVGGGLKLRIMDAFKAGLPVLVHAVSARGYDEFKKAGYLYIYDDQESFEESLKLLLSERSKGRLDKVKIKQLYCSIFSYESGARRLKELLIDFKLIDYNPMSFS